MVWLYIDGAWMSPKPFVQYLYGIIRSRGK